MSHADMAAQEMSQRSTHNFQNGIWNPFQVHLILILFCEFFFLRVFIDSFINTCLLWNHRWNNSGPVQGIGSVSTENIRSTSSSPTSSELFESRVRQISDCRNQMSQNHLHAVVGEFHIIVVHASLLIDNYCTKSAGRILCDLHSLL